MKLVPDFTINEGGHFPETTEGGAVVFDGTDFTECKCGSKATSRLHLGFFEGYRIELAARVCDGCEDVRWIYAVRCEKPCNPSSPVRSVPHVTVELPDGTDETDRSQLVTALAALAREKLTKRHTRPKGDSSMSDPEPEYLPTEPEATQAVPEELLLPPRMFTPGWRCPKCGDDNPKIRIFDLSGGKADTEYFDLVSKSVKVQNATTYAEQLLMTCPQCLYSEARLPRDATRRRYQALADAGVASRTNGLQEYKCPCGCTDHDIEAVDIDGTPGTTAVYCSSCDRLLAAPIRCSLGDLLIGKLMEKNDVQP